MSMRGKFRRRCLQQYFNLPANSNGEDSPELEQSDRAKTEDLLLESNCRIAAKKENW